MTTTHINELSHSIIGAAIEVHKALGPGLLESAYETCLCHELAIRKMSFERQVSLSVNYKNVRLDCGYIQDVIVENTIIIELKSVEHVTQLHRSQLLSYLRLSKRWLGLLINFNVPVLVDGVERIVNGKEP